MAAVTSENQLARAVVLPFIPTAGGGRVRGCPPPIPSHLTLADSRSGRRGRCGSGWRRSCWFSWQAAFNSRCEITDRTRPLERLSVGKLLPLEKKAFLDLLKTLPTRGEVFTDESVKTAAHQTHVLLALTEKDLVEQGYDIYPFLVLSWACVTWQIRASTVSSTSARLPTARSSCSGEQYCSIRKRPRQRLLSSFDLP